MGHNDWAAGQQVALFFTGHEEQHEYSPVTHAIAILYNASGEEAAFSLPTGLPEEWMTRFSSSDEAPCGPEPGQYVLAPRSLALATMGIQVDD